MTAGGRKACTLIAAVGPTHRELAADTRALVVDAATHACAVQCGAPTVRITPHDFNSLRIAFDPMSRNYVVGCNGDREATTYRSALAAGNTGVDDIIVDVYRDVHDASLIDALVGLVAGHRYSLIIAAPPREVRWSARKGSETGADTGGARRARPACLRILRAIAATRFALFSFAPPKAAL